MIETGLCFLAANAAGVVVYLLMERMGSCLKGEEYTRIRHDLYHGMVVVFLGLFLVSWMVNLWLLFTPGFHGWGAGSPAVQGVLTILTWIWIVGAVARLLYYGYFRVCHDRALRNHGLCDQYTEKILQELCDGLGIRRKPAVIQGYGSVIPELIGYRKPMIYLPGDTTRTEDQLRGIIAHELYHYKHYDKWIREAAIVTHCIGWFNPILTRLNQRVELWDEIYCDYAVLRDGILSSKEYGRVICDSAEKIVKWRRPGESFITIGVCEDGKNLKERMKRVLNYQGTKKQKLGSLAAMMVLMILTTCATALATGKVTVSMLEKANDLTMEGYEEEIQVSEVLTEYAAMADEAEQMAVQGDAGAEPQADPRGLFEFTLTNDRWTSGLFYAEAGQIIDVSLNSLPSSVNISVGIYEPSGMLRWVYRGGMVDHGFALDETGYYYVFVKNETTTTVSVSGSYNTYDTE